MCVVTSSNRYPFISCVNAFSKLEKVALRQRLCTSGVKPSVFIWRHADSLCALKGCRKNLNSPNKCVSARVSSCCLSPHPPFTINQQEAKTCLCAPKYDDSLRHVCLSPGRHSLRFHRKPNCEEHVKCIA